jgi:hypothetical protein
MHQRLHRLLWDFDISLSVGVFLTKLTPFHPSEMISAFFETVEFSDYHPAASSSLILLSFVFLSKMGAPPFVEDQFRFSNFSKHLKVDNSLFSEYTVHMIKCLKHFGREWFHFLLLYFIEEMPSDGSRAITKAFGNIIASRPQEYLKEVIEELSEKKTYLGMFSFSESFCTRDI